MNENYSQYQFYQQRAGGTHAPSITTTASNTHGVFPHPQPRDTTMDLDSKKMDTDQLLSHLIDTLTNV